jgi:replication fork clamp-binding protein CrfC
MILIWLGAGIVTRRPLVLQLIHNPIPEDKQKKEESSEAATSPYEWGEFLHIPNQKFHDFNEIRNEIIRETDRVTGKNKNVSPLPIHLKVHSPNVLNLTLIDLPGITKVPVGDQPKDIEIQIRKMILQFITKPNCIILAVSPANADIANSDALKLAREVDPKGERTLGVLTKLDLMDAGTDAMDVLTNQVYPLKRGYVGVVMRGQNDINTNKSIKKAREDEMLFFQRHPSYKNIYDRCGTQYLARTLNNLLLSHIRECLPEIRSKITALIIQAQQRLNEYGVPLAESQMSPGALLLQLLTKFATEFTDSIDGRNADLSTNDLFGGARINHIFVKKYTPYLYKMDACEGLTELDIRTAIRNAKGPRTSLFIPEASFEMLVKRQVQMLLDPSLHCVDQVYEELKTIIDYCEKNLARFPKLKERVKEFVVQLLKEFSQPLKEFIRNLINIELAYINTNHPDFFGGGQTAIMLMNKQAAANAPQQQQPQQPLPVAPQSKTNPPKPPVPVPQPQQVT